MASRADRLYQLLNTTPSSTAILLAVVCIAFAAQQGGFIWAYCRRSSSLTKFSAVPLFVPLPALLGGSLFYLVKAILTYTPAPYRRLAILSAAGVFVMLVFKPINLFRTNARHERRLSVRLAFIDTNTGGQDPRAIERRLKFLSEKAGRYLVCLSGMLMAAAMLVFWSEWPRSTVQGVVSALRSISSLVPRWCLLVPAFFLLMYPFKRPSLSVLAILTSFTFFGTAYITGAHWGWLIVAAWMSITRLMHIRVGFHFRQMEKWWDEFLRQHGLITTIAYRILSHPPSRDVIKRSNRLEFGARIVTFGYLQQGKGFIFYERAYPATSLDPEQEISAYVSAATEIIQALGMAQKTPTFRPWFQFVVVRPTTLSLPVALVYERSVVTTLHVHPQLQDPLASAEENDQIIQRFASGLCDALGLALPSVCIFAGNRAWSVSEIPELAIKAAYEDYHSRVW